MFRFPIWVLTTLLLSACAHQPMFQANDDAAPDPHSFANTAHWQTQHLILDLDVDFATRTLAGTATLELESVDDSDELILDTRDLAIQSVAVRVGSQWRQTPFGLGAPHTFMGRPLWVRMPDGADAVRIAYRTDPGASGLQWLPPEQTAGGEHPFLYSQSQAIHARSWVPLQDTPSVRQTFDANIRTPDHLLAVMGADNSDASERDGDYQFTMPQPIPSYLIALAVGDLEFRAMSERTGVYAEPSVVEAAAAEFDDTEAMMKVTETLYGPYRWGRYDLLILPPSFPYGGMENPRLTFASPTVIAGDKSLVSLVAHELAHSWSGNLVTNADWNQFWLNEGFTNHLTFRIMEEVFGRERGMMERAIGYANLKAALARMDNPQDRTLTPDISSRDPDEGVTSVPYNRGALFLWNLQQSVGEADFDAFLRNWFDAHAFESVTTPQFVAYAEDHLLAVHPDAMSAERIDAWLKQPALPEGHLKPQSSRFARIDALRRDWLAGRINATQLGSSSWSSREWEHFFNGLDAMLLPNQLSALGETLGLNTTDNAIVASKWYEVALNYQYEPAYPHIEEFLLRIGRMKLIVPLYRTAVKTDTGAQWARGIFDRARPGYHPIAVNTIDKLFESR